mmetsp:Transcript_1770/g.5260  ORF Transcript_1770/g.5260 Transcript_1770/m.5260 type:complete len:264 (+) Transcript_1770:747-1538(+)
MSPVGDVVADSPSFGLLERRGLVAEPGVQRRALVEDEAVSRVERVARARHFEDFDGVLDFADPKELRDVGGDVFDLVEAGLDAALQVFNLLKELRELLRFVLHDFAVLDGLLVEVVVELDRLVSRDAHLVLARRLAEPKVNVVHQLVVVQFRRQHDVRVADVKLAPLFLGPLGDLELLDPEDLQALLLPAALPRRLLLRRRLARVLVQITPRQRHVRIRHARPVRRPLLLHLHRGELLRFFRVWRTRRERKEGHARKDKRDSV